MFGAATGPILGLQALTVQEQLLAADAANLATPGFEPAVLDVGQAVLAEENGQRPTAAVVPLARGPDGNGVSLTELMVQVGETQQWYAADARLAQMAYSRVSTAIGTAPLP